MTWPYYVLTFCMTGLMSIFTLLLAGTTVVAVRDKKGLTSITERVIQGAIGGMLTLIIAGATVAVTYLMLNVCDVARC